MRRVCFDFDAICFGQYAHGAQTLTNPGKGMMQVENSCVDCGLPALDGTQKFCHGCGQPSPIQRIDWKFLGQEIEHGLLQVDRGILFTLKNLFVRPGHFLREYLQGRRSGHMKPLPLLLLTAAATLVLGKFFLDGDLVGTDLARDVASGMGQSTTAKSVAATTIIKAKLAQAEVWANQHLTLFTLLLLPLEAAAFKLAHLRAKLNYPEWLVIITYLTVQTFVVWSVLIVLQHWFPAAHVALLPISIALGAFTLMQFFNMLPRWKSVLRALFGFALFQLAISATSFVAAVILALWVLAKV